MINPKYFTLAELIRTDADAQNIPSFTEIDNLRALSIKVLDPIRELWKRPIKVNSGYRSHKVNVLVGGANNSQHIHGEAADITAGDKENNKQLFNLIVSSGIIFDQCIDESDYSWIHISYSTKSNRGQILHL